MRRGYDLKQVIDHFGALLISGLLDAFELLLCFLVGVLLGLLVTTSLLISSVSA